MRKSLPIILPFLIFLMSCEKINIPENYPTTYKKLDSATLSQMRSSFATINPYMTTSVNDFGFCDYYGDPLNVGTPPLQSAITESVAIGIVKTFVSRNQLQTGIPNTDDLTFHSISTTTGYGGAIGWHFKSENQRIDTIEVVYSMILFHLTNGVVTSCYGNWFPQIEIPSRFNFSQKEAIASLNGKVVSHYSFAGTEYTVKISNSDLEKSTTSLKIFPISSDDKIELRVCWQINIPMPVYYLIYIDVMTGKIVDEQPTIIS
jgi:hypothetical protein